MPKGKYQSAATPGRNYGIWDSLSDVVGKPLAQAGNALKNAYNDVANLFSGNNTDIPTPANLTSPSPYYQVGKDDASLSQVADKTGVPLKTIMALNGNASSLPPTGSYISLSDTVRTNEALALNSQIQSYLGRGDPSAQRLRDQASQLASQLQNGILPDSVPSAALGFLKDANGTPLTIQDFIAEGYTMNSAGVLVKGATPTPANNTDYKNTQAYQTWKDTPFLQQKRWDPQRKKYVTIGKLLQEGKLDLKGGWHAGGRKKSSSAPVKPSQPTNREAPSTVLDIHLGSG